MGASKEEERLKNMRDYKDGVVKEGNERVVGGPEWNAINNIGDGIVSGMYIYRYISSEQSIVRKMLYLK